MNYLYSPQYMPSPMQPQMSQPSYYGYTPQSMMNTMQPQNQQSQLAGLQGKIVDSQDVVKATEVPIGGYGIFPKADLSEIYIKTWNNNGTTSIVTYQPMPQPQQLEKVDNLQMLIQKVNSLENKLDSLLMQTQTQTVVQSQPAPPPKTTSVTKPKERMTINNEF